MPKSPESKHVHFSFNTTKEHMDSLGLSEDDVKGLIKYLAALFGTRYLKLFPLALNSNDVSRFQHLRAEFEKVENCLGLKRLIRMMDRNNFDNHLFTVRAAGWLIDLGFEVEFEPGSEKDEQAGVPDLLVTRETNKFAVECKDIDIDEFFDHDDKKQIADFIYDTVQTCDQIDLYLSNPVSLSEVQELFSDPLMVATLYKAGYESQETRFSVSPNIEIGMIRNPAIVGAEEDFLEVAMGCILEDITSQVRLPGFAFMKGGRSVGVYGPPPNFNRRWDDKRSKSKKQALENMPLLVLLNGDNVLGDPQLHRDFFERVWLTGQNEKCSAIGILRMVTLDSSPEVDYLENESALVRMPDSFSALVGCT